MAGQPGVGRAGGRRSSNGDGSGGRWAPVWSMWSNVALGKPPSMTTCSNVQPLMCHATHCFKKKIHFAMVLFIFKS